MQNGNKMNIVVGTSIAPYNIEIQRFAIRSWIRCGLKVISCNVREEIEKLKDQFSDVEFVEIVRTAKETGKPLPYFQDILSLVAQRSDFVCGYINSDIILDGITQEMLAYIGHEAMESLVFLHRNEINSMHDISEMNWDMHFDGIDLFFVDKTIAPVFFDEGFYVQSLWCQALLVKCRKQGIKIKELVNPVAFHIRHTIRWDIEKYRELLKRFVVNNFTNVDNSYNFLIDNYYSILLNDTIKICYCDSETALCHVSGSLGYSKLKCMIVGQDYPYIKIIDSESDENKNSLIFEINDEVILTKCFFKLIVWIFHHFNCKKIELGAFFVSEVKGCYTYNELNRNMYFLKELYSKADRYSICVYSQAGEKALRVCSPMIRKHVDLRNAPFISTLRIIQNTYIMPAGNRACEWLERYGARIPEKLIKGFLDNAESKIGKTVQGLKVYSVNSFDNVNERISVIVASKYYHQEIIQALKQIDNIRGILNASCILDVDNAGTIYYFNEDLYLGYIGDKDGETGDCKHNCTCL